jgi:hypothetical protein
MLTLAIGLCYAGFISLMDVVADVLRQGLALPMGSNFVSST